MQDELFLLEHYGEVAALAALPEGSPEREEAFRRLWELARRDDSPWCAEAMDAPGREGLFSDRRAGLLVAALGLAIVLGMYGLDRLGVSPRVSFALGTLGLIALVAGAAPCNARFERTQEQSFRDRLDAFLECVSKRMDVQVRADLAAIQGNFPQAYRGMSRGIKATPHRTAARQAMPFRGVSVESSIRPRRSA